MADNNELVNSQALRDLYLHHTKAAEADKAEAERLVSRARAHNKVAEGLRTLYPELLNDLPDPVSTGPRFSVSGGGVSIRSLPEVAAPAVVWPPAEPPESTEDFRPPSPPKGWPAVRRVLRRHRQLWLTATEIQVLLVERGWESEDDAGAARVRASINRGLQAGELERRRTPNGVKYRFARASAASEEAADG